MIASLEIALEKQRQYATAMADHFANKNDDKAMELLDELLDYQVMFIRLLNDAWMNVKRTK
ncbi:MAG: hypothetical protein WBF04_24150 [Candidatus Sulfotelmatobacter sp.]|jgi:hypothetical protein